MTEARQHGSVEEAPAGLRYDRFGHLVLARTCPECGGDLKFRRSRTGKWFTGCSNWKAKDCQYTADLWPLEAESLAGVADEVEADLLSRKAHQAPARSGLVCPSCGANLRIEAG